MQQDSQDYQRQLQEDSFRFQSDQQDKNFIFQIHRDEEQRLFQLELEAHRLAFQEKLEMRRLQFQEQMEEKRAELQRTLTELNIRNSQQIAHFQAIAMRETQILVARENAQNTLQDRMVQAALKDFPLNISPLVLLKNRPHSLSSLFRFTIGQECRAIDVYNDVMSYAANPEALNIFVAPVYVDNKIRNRQVLNEQIWDTTYQKLESFFTKYYNRRSKRPVIFYPTAWNDKFNPGMHASEALHFFLKDMPCVVIESRFDGLNFRLMISAWGLGSDFYFTPSKQEYLASPLKWIAFPLLAMVLTYTFCLPRIMKAKGRKMRELIYAVTEEIHQKGQEIIDVSIKKAN